MIAPALVTAWVGSLVAVSRLENVGVAKVGGFYRFPSFEFCKAERCQQDYSAMKATWLKSKLAKTRHAIGAPLIIVFRGGRCIAGAAGFTTQLQSIHQIQCDPFDAAVN